MWCRFKHQASKATQTSVSKAMVSCEDNDVNVVEYLLSYSESEHSKTELKPYSIIYGFQTICCYYEPSTNYRLRNIYYSLLKIYGFRTYIGPD